MNLELNKIYNEDCLIGMKRIPDGSVDVVCTDPPYLYLKNQKLDRPFDEQAFFHEVKRVLKKDGFIVLFGRGTSFYRWNTILADLGFKFKEEIIWDKRYCSSPLMNISRVHETVSIHTKGKGIIKKVKVPYLEMKRHDIDSIVTDIKRLKTTFKNTKSLDSVLPFLKNNNIEKTTDNNLSTTISSVVKNSDRSTSVMQAILNGMNEKTIIRDDFVSSDKYSKYNHTANHESAGSGDRCVNVMNSIYRGMNEKTIIKQGRDHYNTIHPTQKPVRLIERLLALVSKEGDLVFDPFAGSMSTAIACINTKRNFIGLEIDQEYYNKGLERVNKHTKQLNLFES